MSRRGSETTSRNAMTRPKPFVTIGEVEVRQYSDKRCEFIDDLAIDADGCNGGSMDDRGRGLFAYRADDRGLDALANAGYPHGEYWNVLVCDLHGHPIEINRNGRYGFVSSTAYQWAKDTSGMKRPMADPDRYLDSWAVSYIVVNPVVRAHAKGVVLGCRAQVTIGDGDPIPAVVGDVSGGKTIGEGSIELARRLKKASDPTMNLSPRNGGISERVVKYEFWPDTPAIVDGIVYNLIRM